IHRLDLFHQVRLGHLLCRTAATVSVLSLLVVVHESHGLRAHAASNHLFESDKRATTNEQDVRGIHRSEFLMRVFSSALRWNVGYRSLENLEQRLLNALTRNIACDGRILVLAADLIDLV